MAGRYNRWLRAKLADRIRANGGYNRGYHDKYALVWMVRVYGFGTDDAASARAALIEYEHFVNDADLTLQFPDFDEWFAEEVTPDQIYSAVTDCLQSDLIDDEGLRMWGPKVAARYGFDYAGVGADKHFHMRLEAVSSGGKRVALSMFEGHKLQVDNDDLADWIDPEIEDAEYSPTFSNKWCRMLMGIMDELDEVLTTENATRCGRYYATDYIARELGLFD